MKEIEKLAVKYFLLLLGFRLLDYFLVVQLPRILLNISVDAYMALDTEIIFYAGYVLDLVFAIIVFYDAKKHLNNYILIPILTFIMPLFGIAFFLIEKYTLQNLVSHE